MKDVIIWIVAYFPLLLVIVCGLIAHIPEEWWLKTKRLWKKFREI